MDLAYPLTDTVEIDGRVYLLDLAFDNVLRLFDMLNDDELSDVTQVETGLTMLIGTSLDEYDIYKKADVFQEIFKIAVGDDAEDAQPLDIAGNPMPQHNDEEDRKYDFKQDAEYIYASFYQDYGIDLIEQQGKLHWHKFRALLGGLKNDTKFKEVLEIRTMELPTGKGAAKERKRIKELKERYKLKK